MNLRRKLVASMTGFALVTLAAFTPTTALAGGRDVPDSVRDGSWGQVADQTYDTTSRAYRQVVAEGKNVWAFHTAHLAWYAGMRFGWHDHRTAAWLREVYERQNADGGWGLGVAYDAYGDGTVNPANASYTITTAWHVGRMLLDGYDAGAVPRSKVLEAVTSILNTGDSVPDKCVAYSVTDHDAGKPCVWNVTAAAALFLRNALIRGLVPHGRAAETVRKIRAWTDYIVAHYDPALGGWNYNEGGANVLDDPGHLAPTVTAMLTLAPKYGKLGLRTYFATYPKAISAVDMVVYDCTKVDVDYPGFAAFVLDTAGKTPEAVVPYAAYAPTALRVQRVCADGRPVPTPAAAATATAVPNTVASGEWRALGEKALPETLGAAYGLEAVGSPLNAQALSGPTWAAGLGYGWRDERTQAWVKKVVDHRMPSGGWGLEQAWDAFSDGTVNDAQTTYTITTAWHVGLWLIPAYDAGAVSKKVVTQAAASLLNTQETGGGACISYSMNHNDDGKPCIYNVTAAAAWFLANAARRGLAPKGRTVELWDKVGRWTETLRAGYDPAIGDWPYDASRPGTSQGAVYNEVVVVAMLDLDPTFAQQAMAKHFEKWPTSTLLIVSKDCSHADAAYPVFAPSAVAPVPDLRSLMGGRAIHAVFSLLIDQSCRAG